MKTPVLGGEDLTVAKFVTSEAGIDWLQQSTAFGDLLDNFCEAEGSRHASPQEAFRGFKSVGMGGKSEVYEIDGIAVKVCTPTTGKYHWKYGDTSIENLIGQYRFLSVLDDYLDHSENSQGITVPEQFFALRTARGNYIRAERLMTGWGSLSGLASDRSLGRDQEHAINERVKARLIEGVGGFSLRFGLMDLGLERGELLHSANVLVPESADQLDEDRLCIIDQPSNGLKGRAASILAARYLPRLMTECLATSGTTSVPQH